jgi:hypothetical protein
MQKKPISIEKRNEWEEKFRRQKESGFSIDRWCRENQIPPHAFYYWKERLFPKSMIDSLSFTELSNAKTTGITIECRNLRIRLDRQFDPIVLGQCLSILMKTPC